MDSVNRAIVLEQLEQEPTMKKVEQVANLLTVCSAALFLYRCGYVHSRLESIRLREAEE